MSDLEEEEEEEEDFSYIYMAMRAYIWQLIVHDEYERCKKLMEIVKECQK